MIHMQNTHKQVDKFSKNSFEEQFWAETGVVCGIDEVGRGCLAGPLVTAAVILPPHTKNPLLKDSKVLTEAERLKAAAWITTHCRYGIGIVHNRLIDKHNIWHATLIAMKKALMQALYSAPTKPSVVLVDAMPLSLAGTSYQDIPVHYFINGEQKSSSIAAASIIAKVKRDAMMQRFDRFFPGYHLKDHKGYSTVKHKYALVEHSTTIIHRASFVPSLPTIEEVHAQQRLC